MKVKIKYSNIVIVFCWLKHPTLIHKSHKAKPFLIPVYQDVLGSYCIVPHLTLLTFKRQYGALVRRLKDDFLNGPIRDLKDFVNDFWALC